MITKVNNHSPFTVKKAELKSGAAWNKLAEDRAIRQHGDAHAIPQGDAHEVRQFETGPQLPTHTAEEMQQAVSVLEEQIKKLQEKEKNQPVSASPAAPVEKTEKKDDFYDDWLNE